MFNKAQMLSQPGDVGLRYMGEKDEEIDFFFNNVPTFGSLATDKDQGQVNETVTFLRTSLTC